MDDQAARCECCGQRLPGPLTVDELRAWLMAHGHAVLPGDLVDTRAAAALLDLQPQSLRARRDRLPHIRRGRRVLYRLDDLRW